MISYPDNRHRLSCQGFAAKSPDHKQYAQPEAFNLVTFAKGLGAWVFRREHQARCQKCSPMVWLLGWLSWANLSWLLVAGLVGWYAKWLVSNVADTKGRAGPGASAWGEESANGHDDAGAEDEGSSSSFTGSVRLQKLQIKGATGEIERILSSLDHYAVLEVARDATSADIKKSYRLKQMATHPDKNHGVPGAKEASQRVNAAYDTLGNEVHRKRYDARLDDEEQYGIRGARTGGGMSGVSVDELAKAFKEMVRETLGDPPPGAVYPSINPADYDCHSDDPNHTFHMVCSCQFDHVATKVLGRTSASARLCFCDRCGMLGCMLPATHGDVWFEASNRMLSGFAPERFIKAYRCVGRHVYDVTAWAKCNGLMVGANGEPAPCNIHYVPLRMSSSKQDSSSRQRADQDTGDRDQPRGKNSSHHHQHNKANKANKTNNKKKKRR